MGVITPERAPERTEQPAPPQPPPEPPPRRDVPWGWIVLLAMIGAFVWAVGWVRDVIPDFDNPFATETVDRSQRAVLKSIEDIGEYRAASGHFEVIVDLEEDTGFPDEILGTRTLFVAVGTVDSGVDLAAVDEDSVVVSEDRRSATITLPAAQLFPARLDVGRSYVYDREEGVFNEIAGLFSDDANYQQQLYRLAQAKLNTAARQNSGLLRRAEENTREMLEGLLSGLGFTNVSVRFESAASG
jgi:hypothetical protein